MSTQQITTFRKLTGKPELVDFGSVGKLVIVEALCSTQVREFFNKTKISYFFCFSKDWDIINKKFRKGTILKIHGTYRQDYYKKILTETIFADEIEEIKADKNPRVFPELRDEVVMIGKMMGDQSRSSEIFEEEKYSTCYIKVRSKFKGLDGMKQVETPYKLLCDRYTHHMLDYIKHNDLVRVEGNLDTVLYVDFQEDTMNLVNRIIVKTITTVDKTFDTPIQEDDLISIKINQLYGKI